MSNLNLNYRLFSLGNTYRRDKGLLKIDQRFSVSEGNQKTLELVNPDGHKHSFSILVQLQDRGGL